MKFTAKCHTCQAEFASGVSVEVANAKANDCGKRHG